ncbi:hypothetical protein RQP46_001957 [Phenoliferia psychrophenolica]
MQSSQHDSGSESDNDDAPEEITVSSSKKGSRDAQKAEREFIAQAAQAKKAKNRAADAKLKAVKGKAKAAAATSAPTPSDEANGDLSGSDHEVEDEEAPTTTKAGTSTYLDPSLFASAATFFKPAAYPTEGQGKRGMKRAVKEEKRRKAELKEDRDEVIHEGGARSVGSITLQHLPTPSSLTSTISSTTSTTSATKFVSARLFSKKRAVAVLDAGNPQPRRGELEGESRKRKKGSGKGMSAESKALLGMGMDDGSRKRSPLAFIGY